MKILSGGIFERNEKKEENPEVSPVNRCNEEIINNPEMLVELIAADAKALNYYFVKQGYIYL